MAVDKFERIEKKFWMTSGQFEMLEKVLEKHMTVDQYGLSTIRNIYCDTDDYYLIRKSIERPNFKEKLRIRSYSVFKDDTEVYVEIKRKLNDIGYKRRIRIPYGDAVRLLEGRDISTGNMQIRAELAEFIRRYKPVQKVYLTYDRVAMFGKDEPSLRITMDRNIRCSLYHDGMDFSTTGRTVRSDNSDVLMEIKANGRLPEWLTAAMSDLKIYQAPFSKIGTAFTEIIAPELKLS
ncbi:MAG: polyphosphate polymerase domain-containing protein [Parasporobacterium sp.]|nr:polyphosphate polymerase domain-containing protein [Parasporobacterium sp.]